MCRIIFAKSIVIKIGNIIVKNILESDGKCTPQFCFLYARVKNKWGAVIFKILTFPLFLKKCTFAKNIQTIILPYYDFVF